MSTIDTTTPVLLLGGRENSLSVVRSLGRDGIAVSASGDRYCCAMHSRYCSRAFPVPDGQSAAEFWTKLLLSGDKSLRGHIVIGCNDEALEFLATNHAELTRHYKLGDFVPDVMLACLDKMKTLALAREAGIATPKFWQISRVEDIDAIRGELSFPLMVKPLSTYKFASMFKRKLFIIENSFDELKEKVRFALGHGFEVMVVEMIPGPDHRLNSYNTYMDAEGRPLYDYTKHILRRFPVNRGGGCYHMTEWLPETAELGKRFFKSINFRGIGNVEFKRDVRDGKLKVIEINSRFTAAQELFVQSGARVDLIVYCHLTGQEIPRFETYEQFLRFWYPFKDFLSFWELRGRGEMSFRQWVCSIAPYRQVFPIFSLRDPMPFFASIASVVSRLKSRLKGRRFE